VLSETVRQAIVSQCLRLFTGKQGLSTPSRVLTELAILMVGQRLAETSSNKYTFMDMANQQPCRGETPILAGESVG
jgi:hypothetical protein